MADQQESNKSQESSIMRIHK